MKRSLPILLALAGLAFSIPATNLQAQAPAPTGHEVVLQVKDLSSAARDAIANDLRTRGEGRLVYACVPAGILVIEPAATGDAVQLRDRAIESAGRHVARQHISEAGLNRQQAEQRCAQARGQR